MFLFLQQKKNNFKIQIDNMFTQKNKKNPFEKNILKEEKYLKTTRNWPRVVKDREQSSGTTRLGAIGKQELL